MEPLSPVRLGVGPLQQQRRTGIPHLCLPMWERWFNHDFWRKSILNWGLTRGNPAAIAQSIGEGKADDDLLDVLLGVKPKDVTVVVQETQDYPPAKPLIRYSGNRSWLPSKKTPGKANMCSCCRSQDQGMFICSTGPMGMMRFPHRPGCYRRLQGMDCLDYPIFAPRTKEEKKGRGPRVVVIDDHLYMLYTAYDGVTAQIAAASIHVDAFLNREFHRWERMGLAFQDIWDKDAILFPEKIRGKYVIYHRIEPSIWVSFMDKLEFPAGATPSSGALVRWDFLIGAGAQPIKTKYGG